MRVVLVAARNPLNIGAAARAMSNFGFIRLCVVNTYQVSFRRARSAVGAPLLLEQAGEFSTLAEAIADCTLVVGTSALESRHVEQPVYSLDHGGPLLAGHLAAGHAGTGKAAILFGSEKRGLSNHDLNHCHWLMRIPTREEHGSMNLGQAVAVCLYELIRESTVPVVPEKSEVATAVELERMMHVLLEALKISGYTQPQTEAVTAEKLRRMVRRMQLNSPDAETWTGILAKMQRALLYKKS